MIDIIAFAVGMLSSGLVGYGIRALQHPVQVRDKSGRFTKKK